MKKLLLFLLLSISCIAQTTITSNQVFNLGMIGKTWTFHNSLGHTMKVHVLPSPNSTLSRPCAVWLYTKEHSTDYWSVGSGGATLLFEICRESDGGWYSDRSLMRGDTNAGGSPLAWQVTSNVTPVPGQPEGYQIIPPSCTSGITTTLSTSFLNYSKSVLTWNDLTADLTVVPTQVSWQTSCTVINVSTPFYSGPAMQVEQREHCSLPGQLDGGCIDEVWQLYPDDGSGIKGGLGDVLVISASTTWQGFCTFHDATLAFKDCFLFTDVEQTRVPTTIY